MGVQVNTRPVSYIAIAMGMFLGYYIALNLVQIMNFTLGFSDPYAFVILNVASILGTVFFGLFVLYANRENDILNSNRKPGSGMRNYNKEIGGHNILTMVLFATFLLIVASVFVSVITYQVRGTLEGAQVGLLLAFMVLGILAMYSSSIMLATLFSNRSKYYSKLFQPSLYLMINFIWVFIVAVQIMYWRN